MSFAYMKCKHRIVFQRVNAKVSLHAIAKSNLQGLSKGSSVVVDFQYYFSLSTTEQVLIRSVVSHPI